MSIAKVAKAVKRVSLPPYGYQCNGTSHANTLWDTGDLAAHVRVLRRRHEPAVRGHRGQRQRRGRSERVGRSRWYEAIPKRTFHRSVVTRAGTVQAAVRRRVAGGRDERRRDPVPHLRAGRPHGMPRAFWAATVPAGSIAATASLVRAGELRYRVRPRGRTVGRLLRGEPVTPSPRRTSPCSAHSRRTSAAPPPTRSANTSRCSPTPDRAPLASRAYTASKREPLHGRRWARAHLLYRGGWSRWTPRRSCAPWSRVPVWSSSRSSSAGGRPPGAPRHDRSRRRRRPRGHLGIVREDLPPPGPGGLRRRAVRARGELARHRAPAPEPAQFHGSSERRSR